jgi:hypothetical protein
VDLELHVAPRPQAPRPWGRSSLGTSQSYVRNLDPRFHSASWEVDRSDWTTVDRIGSPSSASDLGLTANRDRITTSGGYR